MDYNTKYWWLSTIIEMVNWIWRICYYHKYVW